MNFLTAEVEVKVDDTQLSSQLARTKSTVTRTVDKIKATFSKMATSFKAAFDKMVQAAKWASLAIAGALTVASRAAMKQEDAQFLLAAALKISGEWTQELQYRFEEFAASVQQATIYGDEEVLQLMQLQKSLGVTSNKLEEATKMSIGLATATGRDVQSMAMYIALAQQGEFTMLRRYIPALRTTTDATKQLQIITEFAAAGYKLAEERAKTTSGALRQMWNALGDVAEVIGKTLLSGLKDTAIAMKEWAERNQDRISRWSETVVIYITYVKDMFVTFLRFLVSDFPNSLDVALDVSVALFKGFGKTVGIILSDAILGVVRSELFDKMEADLIYRLVLIREKASLALKHPLLTKGGTSIPAGDLARMKNVAEYERDLSMRIARVERSNREAEGSAITTAEKIKTISKEVAAEIENIAPPELFIKWEEAGKKLEATLSSLGLKPPDWKESLKFEAKKIDIAKQTAAAERDIATKQAAITQRLADEEIATTINTRKILFRDLVERYEYEEGLKEQAAEAARKATGLANKKNIALAQESIDHIRSLNFMSHTERLAELDAEIERKREIWDEESEALALLDEERKRYAQENLTGWDAFGRTLDTWFNNAINWGKNLGEILVNAFKSAADSFADMLMKQEVDWKAFGRMFIHELLSMIIQLQMAYVLKMALQGYDGLGKSVGERFTGLSEFTNPPGINESLDVGYASGGHVLETGIAKVHRGEDIVSAGGRTPQIIVNDYAGVRVEQESSDYEGTKRTVLNLFAHDGEVRRAVSSVRS